MADKILKSKLMLRRDNDYNYEAKKSTFVPLKGEVCLVDTSRGLRARVGDGVTTWEGLSYTDEAIYDAINEIVQRGYYYDGKFYSDSTHEDELTPSLETIYIEAAKSEIYTYNGVKYVSVNESLPTASASIAGVLKLYNEKGANTDGTMTQKAITDAINEKASVILDNAEELLIFY